VINKGIGAWSPDAMTNMSLPELYAWYDIALAQMDADANALKQQA
jgi:hypothetical protein